MSDAITPNQSRWVLGMFAKYPQPGLVKSRLAAETSPAWAAGVARAFLLDLLDRFGTFPVLRVLVFAPESADFVTLNRGRFELAPQTDGDLGTRLGAFMHQQFQDSAERVVLIGTDSPTLPCSILEQAFAALANADVVIGPATDGGYYLIGCRRSLPELFRDIAWGGDRVLLDTVARARDLGLQFAVLPPWYDVDTLSDWRMLRGHLAALRQAGTPMALPHTDAIPDFA